MIKHSIKSKLIFCALSIFFVACLAFGILSVPNVANAKEITSIKIVVDSETYNLYDLPCGVVGRTYPVFNCVATDNNGDAVTEIETLVYDPDGQLVSIVDNRFSTAKVGMYQVEYIASAKGVQNTFTAKVNVVAENDYTEISYAISDKTVSVANTGSKVYLYDTEPTGGSGVIKVETDVVYSGDYTVNDICIYDYSDAKYFVPIAEGIYQLKYTLLDITGEPKIVSKDITVSDSGIPVISEPSFPAVYTINEVISLPRVQSVLYTNGKVVYLPVKMFVNETEVSESAKYTATTAGDFVVKYISVNPFDTSKKSEIVKDIQVLPKKAAADPIINTKFYLDGLTASYRGKSDEVELESYVYLLNADGLKENAEMSFRNKISTKFLSVSTGIESSLYNFNYVGIRFTDSVNGSHYIDIALQKTNDDSIMNVCYKGKVIGEVSTLSPLSVNYDYLTKTFTCSDMVSFTPNIYENGDKFEGFESNYAYFSLTLNGISGESCLKLYEIASQKITNAIIDNASPVIIRGTFTGVYNTDIGKAITLPMLDTFDLLSENISLSLNIVSPTDKEYSVSNMTDDYIFTSDEYGTYRVTYTAKDQAGKTKTFICTINVLDRIPPQIMVEQIGNVKVGEKITFPKADVIDNNDAIYYKWITVEYDNYVKEIAIDDIWEFKFAGTYIIEYGASDEDGNYTVYKYTITCE